MTHKFFCNIHRQLVSPILASIFPQRVYIQCTNWLNTGALDVPLEITKRIVGPVAILPGLALLAKPLPYFLYVPIALNSIHRIYKMFAFFENFLSL